MSKAERRTAIIDAAVAIVWEKGLGSATVRAVAAALGASPGQIHHHFSSADELRAEAFREAWRRMTPAILGQIERKPPLERLVALTSGFKGDEHALVERLWRDALAAARMEAGVREAVREQLCHWRGAYVSALVEGKASGEVAVGIDEEGVAQRLMALSLGLDVFDLVAHREDECPDREVLVREAIGIELNRG